MALEVPVAVRGDGVVGQEEPPRRRSGRRTPAAGASARPRARPSRRLLPCRRLGGRGARRTRVMRWPSISTTSRRRSSTTTESPTSQQYGTTLPRHGLFSGTASASCCQSPARQPTEGTRRAAAAAAEADASSERVVGSAGRGPEGVHGTGHGAQLIVLAPNPRRSQQPRHGSVPFQPAGGVTTLNVKSYVKPGDSSVLGSTRRKGDAQLRRAVDVEKPKEDDLSLTVKFNSLPDGTTYPETVVLDVTAKKVVVNITNSGYKRQPRSRCLYPDAHGPILCARMKPVLRKPAPTDSFDAVKRVGLALPGVEATTRYNGSPTLKAGAVHGGAGDASNPPRQTRSSYG